MTRSVLERWLFLTVLTLALGWGALTRAAEVDRDALAQKAQTVLRTYCYRCHGREGMVEGGLNYILNLKTLVARQKVLPGNPARSKIFKRITSTSNPMPPEEETLRPRPEEIALLRQWIEAGAPDLPAVAAPRALLTDNQVLQYIQDDLQTREERSRRFTRYFTITHLYNAGLSEEELQTYRNGLSKLVNSLSWEPDIVVPRPVDPARTILRIDLRDYRWTAALWNRLLEQYPYGIFADTPAARALRAATDCDLPYVRADWWVFAASRPPFYHDLLQLPATDKELERDLKVEVAADIQEERVARAGFNGSGVSQNNRLIERHRSSYGAYWKSYDFAANAGRKNLFAHPLGPGTEDRDFQQDGGEIIFNLPNGLQAYLLVDGRGRRLNEGPTKIVSVKNQPDPAVINGISCMYCHARGMIDKADQVREHAAKNPAAFSDADAQTIRALYPPEEEFRTLLHQDAERFERAMLQAGVQPGATEPVVALAGRFEAEVDLPTAAAEVGVPPTVLLQGLDKFPRLAQDLGPLKVAGGTVKRQVLVHAFPDLVLAFRLGTPLLLLNQAMARATAAIESNPANPEPYFQRGNIHFDKGAMEKASADYSEAIRLGLRTGAVFQNRGMAYATQGDPDRAIADYSEALKLDRRDGETYHNRGLAYAQKSDWAQALADLDNTIRLDPRDASAYSDRGFVQAQRHEWTKALADFQTALQLDPHSALTHGRQGDVYQALGDYDRAIAAYDQALRLNPGLVQVHLARERANTQRGKEKAQAPPRESP